MHDKVQAAPSLQDCLKNRRKLRVLPHVTEHNWRITDRLHGFSHIRLCLCVTVSNLLLGAAFMEHLCAAVRDAVRVGNAHDQAFFAFEIDNAFHRLLFTTNKPIIFAFHGYPLLIHRLAYRRTNNHNLHVRGYTEEGTTTTPFDRVVLNDLDRFYLVADVIDRVPAFGPRAAYALQAIRDKLLEHKQYIARRGEDMPVNRNWKWGVASRS